MTPSERAAALLDAAADGIDHAPGVHLLDALCAAGDQLDATDRQRGDAYYALLDYMLPHVDQLGPWSDRNAPDYVAAKLRACARTLRRGGPARIEDQPPAPAPRADVELVDRATHARRRKAHTFTEDGRLRLQLGQLRSVLTRQQKARHPDPAKITATELEIVDVERQLAQLTTPDLRIVG